LKESQSTSAAQATFDNLNDLIIDAIQDIKGQNIVKLDLTKLDDASADYFIVCQGESTTQVNAIAENIAKRAKDELQMPASHKEGMEGSKWVLIDFFVTIVHVFYPETRAFYDIEDLWSDADVVEYQNI